MSTLKKSWTSKGPNHEVSQPSYSNHTPFNQGTMYILMKGLKVSCPVLLIVHAQNKIGTYYVGKKMISLQKGSGNWSPGSEKMESYLWRNHILQWKNNMMLRYTFKQRHVRSGIFSFHYVLHYLRVRLNLEVYIFQNTISPALRKYSSQQSIGVFYSSIRIVEEHPQNSNPKWHEGEKKLDLRQSIIEIDCYRLFYYRNRKIKTLRGYMIITFKKVYNLILRWT